MPADAEQSTGSAGLAGRLRWLLSWLLKGVRSSLGCIHKLAEFVSFLAIISGAYWAVYTYQQDSIDKAHRDGQETYNIVDNRWLDYVKLSLQYPNLDGFSDRTKGFAPSNLSPDDRQRQRLLYSYLTDVFEVAYVRYFKTEGIPKDIRSRMIATQWPGWLLYIEKFLGSRMLSMDDIVEPDSLATRLLKPAQADHVSQFLAARLSTDTRALLAQGGGAATQMAARALADELNAVIKGGSIYEEGRFANVKLSEETSLILRQRPEDRDVLRLNRLLLQDAYPRELSVRYLGRLAYRETWFAIHDEYDTDFARYMDGISTPPRVSLPNDEAPE